MAWFARLKQHARLLKADTLALYFAARHPATPWSARLLVAAIIAYALSPIDLIPDFIPILGFLDDLILIPLGIALAIRLIPDAVLAECRARASKLAGTGKRVSYVAAIVVVVLWLILSSLFTMWVYKAFTAVS
jgi:uncharacterized membrane protein YkvA (DUF1232 family)